MPLRVWCRRGGRFRRPADDVPAAPGSGEEAGHAGADRSARALAEARRTAPARRDRSRSSRKWQPGRTRACRTSGSTRRSWCRSRASGMGPTFRSSSADGRIYSKAQAHRMSVLSCVAAGDIFDEKCMLIINADDAIDRELRQLSALANAATLRGDPNYIVRRGALLHGDVGMLASSSMDAPFDARPGGGPQSWRMEISDGQELALRSTAVHWEIARMLLDFVIPKGLDRVAPQRDDMVLAWYRATSAWMQLHEDHDEMHLTRGLRDLSGRSRSPVSGGVPAARRSRGRRFRQPSAPPSCRLASRWASDPIPTELREAERLFRRTLEVKPSYVEARMRYGRVLGGSASMPRLSSSCGVRSAELTETGIVVLRASIPRRRRGGAWESRSGAGGLRAGRRPVSAWRSHRSWRSASSRGGTAIATARCARSDRLFALQDERDRARRSLVEVPHRAGA